MNSLIDEEGLLWKICLEKQLRGVHISINIWWATAAVLACVCVFSGGLVIYMCVYKGFHMKSHFKRSFKWGRRSLSHSISILEECNFLLLCVILSISTFFYPLFAAVFSSNLAIYPPWKLNEGTCCVGSALSGPTEKSYLILHYISQHGRKKWAKESISSYNCPLAAFHCPLL